MSATKFHTHTKQLAKSHSILTKQIRKCPENVRLSAPFRSTIIRRF
jgi:hypothetical protein